MKLTFHPTEDRVLLELLEGYNKTDAGLVLPPGTNLPQMLLHRVVAVGPGRTTPEGKLIPMTLKVDDVVILGGSVSAASRMIEVNGQKQGICREGDIAARVDIDETPTTTRVEAPEALQ